VQQIGRRTLARGSLALHALTGRRERAAAWAKLVADVGALPAPPALHRSVSVVVIAPDDTVADAAARAAVETTDLLCFLPSSSTTLEPGWLARLAAAVDGESTVAATPLVVHPLRPARFATPHDGQVRHRGLELDTADDAPLLRAHDAGRPARLDAPVERVGGGSAACLVVDRRAYESVGGLPRFDDLDVAIFELGRRMRDRGGHIVAVPDAVVVDHRAVPSRSALTQPVPTDTPAWRAYVEERGAELMREASPLPEGKLRIVLTVAAPSEKVAGRWGDWHLAQAFAAATRRHGHVVRVQTFDHVDDLAGRACDVHCVVRGLRRVRRTPGQAHVIWVISHPEDIEAPECDEADLVLVASARFAESLRRRTHTPVEVMLQATDVTRFHPVPVDPRHAHDVAIVAKSRNVFRPAVADALAAGVRPAIYGSGWEPFVDPALVVCEYVANEELATVYSSVGVLLNDHWQTMRAEGFVSNRLFDALACGTPVISEDLPEIAELFDGAVLTYHDADELRALIASTLAGPVGARERAARGGELVRHHHTFDHRAEQFLDALRRHGLSY
jgi:glycosyltransferase involved in cell wall biosynthesis